MADTEHELRIKAFVQDLATPQLKQIEKQIHQLTGTTTASTAATRAQTTAAREQGLAASVLNKNILGATAGFIGFSSAVSLASRGAREFIDQALRMSEVAAQSEEIRSAFGFVFGDIAGGARAEFEQLAASTGRFSDEVLDAAVSFQLMLEPVTGVKEEAKDLSLALSQVAIDLGSLRNVAPQEAFGRVQSFIAGNSEALRTMVGFIDEATIAEKALALGFAETTAELTQQDKSIARIGVVIDVLGSAIGDAERTADSFTNTLVALDAATKEARRDLGEGLNVAFLELVDAAGGVEGIAGAVGVALESIQVFALATVESVRAVAEPIAELDETVKRLTGGSGLGDLVVVLAKFQADQVSAPFRLLNFQLAQLGLSAGQAADEIEAAAEQEETALERVTRLYKESVDAFRERSLAAKEAAAEIAAAQEREKFGLGIRAEHLKLDLELAETTEERIAAMRALLNDEILRLDLARQEAGIERALGDTFDLMVSKKQQLLQISIEALRTAERTAAAELQADAAATRREAIEARALGVAQLREFMHGEAVQLEQELLRLQGDAVGLEDHRLVTERHALTLRLEELRVGSELTDQQRQLVELFDRVAEERSESVRLAMDEAAAQKRIAQFASDHATEISLIRGGVGDLANAFADTALGAEDAFARAFDNIIANIIRAQAEAFLLKSVLSIGTGFGLDGASLAAALGIASAKGNVFQGGDVVPFAFGGVFDRGGVDPALFAAGAGFGGPGAIIQSPIAFPLGIAGEKGKEAIVPLERMPNGKLGVGSSGGGGPVTLTINNTIIAQPGQSEEAIAAAVVHRLQTDPSFKATLARAGGVL